MHPDIRIISSKLAIPTAPLSPSLFSMVSWVLLPVLFGAFRTVSSRQKENPGIRDPDRTIPRTLSARQCCGWRSSCFSAALRLCWSRARVRPSPLLSVRWYRASACRRPCSLAETKMSRKAFHEMRSQINSSKRIWTTCRTLRRLSRPLSSLAFSCSSARSSLAPSRSSSIDEVCFCLVP